MKRPSEWQTPPSSNSNSELSEVERDLLERARAQRSRLEPTESVLESVLAGVREANSGRDGSRPGAAELALPRLGDSRSGGSRPGVLRRLTVAVAVAAAMAGLLVDRSTEKQAPVAWTEGELEGMELFQKTAQALPDFPAGDVAENLLSGAPFGPEGHGWQLRHWENLREDPTTEVEHKFEREAVCFALSSGERILGAWPWGRENEAKPLSALALRKGQKYSLSFEVWASAPKSVRLLAAVGHAAAPYSSIAGARIPVTSNRQRYSVGFVPEYDDPSAGIAFLARGALDSGRVQVCLANVRLESPAGEKL